MTGKEHGESRAVPGTVERVRQKEYEGKSTGETAREKE